MTVDAARAALRGLGLGRRGPGALEQDGAVQAALARLPRRYAHLLIFHYTWGYTQREAMRATKTRSWQDWKRAEAALMKELADDE